MKWLLSSFFIVFNLLTHAQFNFSVSGKVVDAVTQQPIINASVFLSNTSLGTNTKSDGTFLIERIGSGKFDLVISLVGYETSVQTIQVEANLNNLIIQLKPKANTLDAVTVLPFEKDGWEKWGRFFIENFLGTNDFSKDCKIVNTKTLRFRHDKKNKVLTVVAFDPLVIENKALGYTIQYQLEDFTYKFSTNVLLYVGYPLFKPMVTKRKNLQERWLKNREVAYLGSMMHFFRAVYRNDLVNAGFEVRKLEKQPNAEKIRIQQLYAKAFQLNNSNNIIAIDGDAIPIGINKDSVKYYNNILRQPDAINILYDKILPGDSIAFGINTTTAGMNFTNFLDITYTKAKPASSYLQLSPQNASFEQQVSPITLVNEKYLEVFSNGSFYSPTNVLSSGYWAWNDKMANLLPNDYKPQTTASSY